MRIHEIGYEDRPPTPEELERMKQLVRQAMEEGALGVGSSLIYAPAFYAKTDELIELCKVVAEYDGMYTSHMRSEGNRLLESVDEILQIMRDAGVPAEIYHLKAAGEKNWPKLDQLIERMKPLAREGLKITRRHVHVHGRRDRPRRRDAALGAGRRLPAMGRAARDPETRARVLARNANAGRRVGKPHAARRLARQGAADRVQERKAQAAHRQDAGRSGRCAASRRKRRRWTW